jgi:uncharacterized membrane protein
MSVPLEHRIASLLRAGMTVAAIVICAGAAWFLIAHGVDPADYRTHHPPHAPLGEGRGLMQLGIVILVVTPIARVAFSICAFAKARNRLYAGLSGVVLCILLYSLLGGH